MCLATTFLTAVMLIGLGGVAWGADEAAGQRKWDFQADAVGQMPAGFRSAVGRWTIVDDGGNHVLAQTARNEDAVFNVIIRTDVLYSDVDVSVRLRGMKGFVDQGGGIIWRVKNAKSYYLARYNPLEDSFRVYKVLDGKRSQLASVKAPGDTHWHTLRVTMKGSKIHSTFDSRIQIDLEDDSIRGFGRIGLWTKSDSQSYFDDLQSSGPAMTPKPAEPQQETKVFELHGGQPFLGGQGVDLWGLRCGNAFVSDAVTERYIRNFDNMTAHGINFVGAYLQGVAEGFPNKEASLNGFTRNGMLLPEVARRAEWFIREADKRGMVVMLGVLTPPKDQDFYDDAAIRRAVEQTAKFLTEKRLNNVFVNLLDEFNDPVNANKPLLREPDGVRERAMITGWFKAIAPQIPVGLGTHGKVGTEADSTMDVRIIRKDMPIPQPGFAVNVAPTREDYFQNDGLFNQSSRDAVYADCRKYLAGPKAAYLFDSAFVQGITNYSGTAPHAEMGGSGTGPNDRGVRFYYEWVRDNVGRWEYPHHVPSSDFSLEP